MMRSKSNLTESSRKSRMTSEEREKKEKGEGGLQRRASKKMGSERKGREPATKKSVVLLGEVGGEGQAVTVVDEAEALEMERKREEERAAKELEDQRRREEEELRKKAEEEARRKAEEERQAAQEAKEAEEKRAQEENLSAKSRRLIAK